MKHLFIIGSHTPFLTALGTIDYLGLKKEDVIFIFGRNYKFSLPIEKYESYDMTDLYYIYIKGNTRKNIVEHVNKIDKKIEDIFGAEEYVLYIPHLIHFFFQICATNRHCRDVKFIQEGIIDLCKPTQIIYRPELKDIFINLFYTNFGRIKMMYSHSWSGDKGFLKNLSITETFAISEKLFQNLNCKHTIVKWPSFNLPFDLPSGCTIFIMDSIVEMKFCEVDVFMDAVKTIATRYGGEINYIKFHPYQNKENINNIKEIFKHQQKQLVDLPNDIPFEVVISSTHKYKVVGFSSSLLFFASQLGHETHLCVSTLLKSKIFNKYWNNYKKQLSCYGNEFVLE